MYFRGGFLMRLSREVVWLTIEIRDPARRDAGNWVGHALQLSTLLFSHLAPQRDHHRLGTAHTTAACISDRGTA